MSLDVKVEWGMGRVRMIDIWEDKDTFVSEYESESYFPMTISSTNCEVLYNLVMSRYYNRQLVQNISPNVWKTSFWSIVYQYGLYWEKQNEIQKTLRNLSETDLLLGQQQITNISANDGTPLASENEVKLNSDNQSRTFNKRSKIEAYTALSAILRSDYTKEFLDHFNELFTRMSVGTSYLDKIYSDDDEEANE